MGVWTLAVLLLDGFLHDWIRRDCPRDTRWQGHFRRLGIVGYVGRNLPHSAANCGFYLCIGVAAMTILISVLSEAYSSRYKSALKNSTFSRAIKSFEGKQKQLELQHHEKDHDSETDEGDEDFEGIRNTPEVDAEEVEDSPISPLEDPPSEDASRNSENSTEREAGIDDHGTEHNGRRTTALNSPVFTPLRQLSRPPSPSPAKLARAILTKRRQHLDQIPLDVIRHAKSFHEHVRYFAHHPNGTSATGSPGASTQPPLREFQELLNEIADSERMDDQMKAEMMRDEDARRALFFMSYDRESPTRYILSPFVS